MRVGRGPGGVKVLTPTMATFSILLLWVMLVRCIRGC